MTENEFRDAVHDLLARPVDGLSLQDKKAIVEKALVDEDRKPGPFDWTIRQATRLIPWTAGAFAWLGSFAFLMLFPGNDLVTLVIGLVVGFVLWVVLMTGFFFLSATIELNFFPKTTEPTAEPGAPADRPPG